jgi:hypothetical protein
MLYAKNQISQQNSMEKLTFLVPCCQEKKKLINLYIYAGSVGGRQFSK